jgi:hypothetical protein
MSGDELFSRDEVLAGGSGAARDTRRARSVCYLIEQEAQRSGDRRQGLAAAGTAASAMAGSPVNLEDLLDAEARRGALPGEADDAWLESFRAARRGAKHPDLRRLNQQADAWSSLVPERLDLRARVFEQLLSRYALDQRTGKRVLAAFGADDPAFRDAFAKVAGRTLDEAVPEPTGLFSRFRRR